MIILQTQDGTCYKYEGSIQISFLGNMIEIVFEAENRGWQTKGIDYIWKEKIKSIFGIDRPLYPVYPRQLGIITNVGE